MLNADNIKQWVVGWQIALLDGRLLLALSPYMEIISGALIGKAISPTHPFVGCNGGNLYNKFMNIMLDMIYITYLHFHQSVIKHCGTGSVLI